MYTPIHSSNPIIAIIAPSLIPSPKPAKSLKDRTLCHDILGPLASLRSLPIDILQRGFYVAGLAVDAAVACG